jgi:hypothetical protein
MPHIEYVAYGALGAASLELLKLYEYRGKLRADRFRRLIRSGMFWSIVTGMLAASGFIAWAMHADSPDSRIWTVVITGIAARSIVRELGAAKVTAAPIKLGPAESDQASLREIFL